MILKSLAVNAERLIARNASHVIFGCRHDARIAQEWKLLGRRTTTSVVYYGISFNGIPQAEPGERKHVGFIGRLVDQKDPLLFVDVIERLPGYSATIVGGGPLEHAVKAEVERRKLRQVKMLGSVPHLEALRALSQFGVLVMTSKWEGLPILVLEAMWAGVPIVATDAGGAGEAIEDGQTGMLLGNRSPDAIARPVRQVTEDSALREFIIQNARDKVQTLFSEEPMLAEIQRVYEEVAGQ